MRLIHFPALLGLLLFFGCGKAEVAESPQPNQQVRPAAVSVTSEPTPVDIVSQFLDQIRRGGEDSGAGTLLTAKARAELKRIGRSIEPMGSPDASYRVTRSEPVPGEEGSAFVHSVWSDPQAEGGTNDYQVVWAVEKEKDGWRISGMAIQEEENQEPVIIDFENGEMMAQVLGSSEQSQSEPDNVNPGQATGTPSQPAGSQAAAPGAAPIR